MFPSRFHSRTNDVHDDPFGHLRFSQAKFEPTIYELKFQQVWTDAIIWMVRLSSVSLYKSLASSAHVSLKSFQIEGEFESATTGHHFTLF